MHTGSYTVDVEHVRVPLDAPQAALIAAAAPAWAALPDAVERLELARLHVMLGLGRLHVHESSRGQWTDRPAPVSAVTQQRTLFGDVVRTHPPMTLSASAAQDHATCFECRARPGAKCGAFGTGFPELAHRRCAACRAARAACVLCAVAADAAAARTKHVGTAASPVLHEVMARIARYPDKCVLVTSPFPAATALVQSACEAAQYAVLQVTAAGGCTGTLAMDDASAYLTTRRCFSSGRPTVLFATAFAPLPDAVMDQVDAVVAFDTRRRKAHAKLLGKVLSSPTRAARLQVHVVTCADDASCARA